MKYMVTGSEGFIGRRLVQRLKELCHEVKEIDKQHGTNGILDRILLDDMCKGVDGIFHLGSISGSTHFDFTSLSHAVSVNCIGTVNVLEAARRNNVKRVVYSSTMSSYGFTPLPHTEDNPITIPNYYVATKVFGEFVCKLHHSLMGLETVILRYASVYGPGEEVKGLTANIVSLFLWNMMKGKQPVLFSKGEQTRDFVYVDDVIEANVVAMEKGKPGEIYNVSTNVATSFNTLVEMINRLLGTSIKPIYEPYMQSHIQKKYIDDQCADFIKLMRLGWRPQYMLEDGIEKMIENISHTQRDFEKIKIQF